MTTARRPASTRPHRLLPCVASWRGPSAAAALLLSLSLTTPARALDWTCPEAGLGDQACGRATCGDSDVTVGDALLALQASVGTASCSDCRCDTDSSGSVRASDASRILAASVGQPVAMNCPACNSLTIDAAAEAADVGATADEVAASGDGGVVTAWAANGVVYTRRYGASLDPAAAPVEMASAPAWKFSLRACGRPNGSAAVAWESDPPLSFPAPHDYDDTGNVRAAQSQGPGDTTGEMGLHEEASGWQTPLGLFCQPSGRFTAIWKSACIGYREYAEGASTSYTPQNCPRNGIYLQRFAADGSPQSDAKLFVPTYSQWYLPWERAIALPDGRFAVATTNRLIVSNAYGNVEVDKTMPSPSHLTLRHDCSAGSDHCVAMRDVNGLFALVHDVDSTDDGIGVILRAAESSYEPPLDITIRPQAVTLACDAQGICVAAWNLVRVEQNWDDGDFEEWIPLGMFARAFNVHTGELGAELALTTQRIINAGPGRFVSVEAGEGGTKLRSLVVH